MKAPAHVRGPHRLRAGASFGHENLGQVVEGVGRLQVGDWVCLPFNVACGFCANCTRGLTNYCLTAQPMDNMAGAAYGFADMGPWQGGQAEMLRVPWADFNPLRLPEDAEEKQDDYVMVADIFPTGWHATEMAGLQSGETIVIYGGGRLAESIGCVAIDDSKENPVERVIPGDQRPRRTPGLRVRRLPGARPAGPRAPEPEPQQPRSIGEVDRRDRRRRRLRPRGPGRVGPLREGRQDRHRLRDDVVQGPEDGHRPVPGQRYNRHLSNLIHAGWAQPSFIVSHRLGLDEAPGAYSTSTAATTGGRRSCSSPGTPGAVAHA
jgi:glutathione-independent formaldehyde dehydrogenase